MTVVVALKRLLITILFLVIVLVAGGPWALYWAGLNAIDGRPSLPKAVATQAEMQSIWQKFRGAGEPVIVRWSPHGYIFDFFNDAFEGKNIRASETIVGWIASGYNLEHRKYKGGVWWHLSGAALTIWMTRNWTQEQILSKVVEMDHEVARRKEEIEQAEAAGLEQR